MNTVEHTQANCQCQAHTVRYTNSMKRTVVFLWIALISGCRLKLGWLFGTHTENEFQEFDDMVEKLITFRTMLPK